jgi:secondary thiamine-phosphate synthase enzyme
MSAFSVEGRTRTTEAVRVRDITREVAEVVRRSGIRDGICCVYSPLTTCAVRVNEFETGFLEDFASLLTRLAPSARRHAPPNAVASAEEEADSRKRWARCVSMLLGPAGESIPVSDRELCLGTWQRVLFVDVDGGRERENCWHVQVIGS